MDQRGFIAVDEHLRTNIEDVYACGDIVTFPLTCFNVPSANIQHWQMAMKHGICFWFPCSYTTHLIIYLGQTAALNLLGNSAAIYSVPFFWSVMFGKSLRYTGRYYNKLMTKI